MHSPADNVQFYNCDCDCVNGQTRVIREERVYTETERDGERERLDRDRVVQLRIENFICLYDTAAR